MFSRIMRERRKRKWKSTAKWRKAKAKKERLEKKLAKTNERLEPDYMHNENGILIAVYKCRSRYRREIRFEFLRNDARGPVSDFGVNDLQALIRAVESARLYGNDAT